MEPARPYSTDIGELQRDSAGLLWVIHQHVTRTGASQDYARELLCLALFSEGGVITPGTLGLTGSVVSVEGPHFGITKDARTPVMFDPDGEEESLDLSAAPFASFADGTHTVVIAAEPVLSSVSFNTQARVVRDTSGNVLETIPAEALTHGMTGTLGVLTAREGTSIEDGDVPVATVVKSGSSWGSLSAVTVEPVFRYAAS